MTDKDKSFFAKIILVSVIFVAFLTVLGLMGEVVRNKKEVNREPQVLISPEPTVAPVVKNETMDLSIFDLLASQDINIKWGTIARETDYSIFHNGSDVQVNGYSREGIMYSNNLDAGTTMGDPVKLETMGWKDDPDMSVGGVYGDGWSYIRNLNDKSQVLELSYVNKTAQDEMRKDSNYDPASFTPNCPCTYTYYIFFSNPF